MAPRNSINSTISLSLDLGSTGALIKHVFFGQGSYTLLLYYCLPETAVFSYQQPVGGIIHTFLLQLCLVYSGYRCNVLIIAYLVFRENQRWNRASLPGYVPVFKHIYTCQQQFSTAFLLILYGWEHVLKAFCVERWKAAPVLFVILL